MMLEIKSDCNWPTGLVNKINFVYIQVDIGRKNHCKLCWFGQILNLLNSCNLLLNVSFGGSDVVSVSCFGVRVSVMFHFMFVHYTFSSVATFWEIAARSVSNLFSLYFVYL